MTRKRYMIAARHFTIWLVNTWTCPVQCVFWIWPFDLDFWTLLLKICLGAIYGSLLKYFTWLLVNTWTCTLKCVFPDVFFISFSWCQPFKNGNSNCTIHNRATWYLFKAFLCTETFTYITPIKQCCKDSQTCTLSFLWVCPWGDSPCPPQSMSCKLIGTTQLVYVWKLVNSIKLSWLKNSMSVNQLNLVKGI